MPRRAVRVARRMLAWLAPMAVVKPFRALRYDEAAAGPLETLVAPPYDVISHEQRAELRARNPHNVVRLTLPDSEEEAARTLARLARATGVLVDEPPPSGRSRRTTSAPTASPARATGLVASLRVEPYETGDGAAARAHAPRPEGGPAAAAARDARAARADLPALRRRAAARAARPRARPRGRGRAALAARRPDARPSASPTGSS